MSVKNVNKHLPVDQSFADKFKIVVSSSIWLKYYIQLDRFSRQDGTKTITRLDVHKLQTNYTALSLKLDII